MIDIHTHILPGMDDGARNTEESTKLVEALYYQGISLIVLTPHFYPHRESLESFLCRREKSYELIRKHYINIDFNLSVEFVVASETLLSENLLWNDDISELCMGDTNYLLLELPFTKEWSHRVYKMIEGLMGKFGIRPIIAHIERYPAINRRAEREDILKNLSDIGCMFQIDTDSVTNIRTRHSMLKLIKSGWVDFVGSDCHDTTVRKPQFDKFNEIIQKKLGQEYLYNFEKNAKKVLNSEY